MAERGRLITVRLKRGRALVIRGTGVTGYPAGHSALMLAAWIILAHFSVSSARSLPYSAGESASGMLPRQRNEGANGVDGRSLGNGTAISAVAPSQRPVCDAHRSKIFGSGMPIMSPRARIPGRLTSSRLISSARTAADPTLSPCFVTQPIQKRFEPTSKLVYPIRRPANHGRPLQKADHP